MGDRDWLYVKNTTEDNDYIKGQFEYGIGFKNVQKHVHPVANNTPTLTAFTTVIDTTDEDTQVELTFAELTAQGDQADSDGTVDAFIVQTLSTGTLKIGTSSATATAFDASTNNKVDATNNAYWTPNLDEIGTLNSFTVVARDDGGADSDTAIQTQVSVLVALTVTITSDKDSLTVGETATITFTLSEASDDFGKVDVNVVGGVLSSFTKVNSTLHTAIFTPTEESTTDGTIGVNANMFSGLSSKSNNIAAIQKVLSIDTFVPPLESEVMKLQVGNDNYNLGFTDNAINNKCKVSTDNGVSYTEYTILESPTLYTPVISLTTTSHDIWLSCDDNTLLNDYHGDNNIIGLTQWGTKGPIFGYDDDNDNEEGGAFTNDNENITINATDNLINFTTNMYEMFNGYNNRIIITNGISEMNVSNVTTMEDAFLGAEINDDITSWDVSSVTNMHWMFSGTKFDQDISTWNVSNVTNMRNMFRRSTFNQDISDWNVSNVINMEGMFSSNSFFDHDISDWDVSNVNDFDEMFRSTNLSETNQCAIAEGWGWDNATANIAYLNGTNSGFDIASCNTIPTLTAFTTVIDTTDEDTEVEITFDELKAQGDEADSDGTVNAFIVQALSTGTLKIGTSSATASIFNASSNNEINSTFNAYWTPALNANGTLNSFTVKAEDDGEKKSDTAVQTTISVTAVNDAPTNITFDDGNTVNQSAGVNAEVTELTTVDVDDGGGNISYTLVSGEGDTDNALFRVLNGDVDVLDPSGMLGNYTIRIQAEDARAGRFSKAFTITVVDDVKPSIVITSVKDSIIFGESTLITFTLSEATDTFGTVDIDVVGGTLSLFSATNSSIYTALFTPTANSRATIDVKAGMFDDNAGNPNSVAIQKIIMIDNPPTLATLANVSATEDDADKDVPLVSNDIDGDAITYTINSSDTSLVTVTRIGDILTLDYQDNAFGSAIIEVNATANGQTATRSFTVTVLAVDDVPTLDALADVNAIEDDKNKTITLVSNDIENDTISYSVSSSDTSLVTVSISGDILTLDYQDNAFGSATIEVNATANGQRATQSFTIHVLAVDDAPKLNPIANINSIEDASSFNITLVATDEENNPISYTATSSNSNIATVKIVNGVLIVNQGEDEFGSVTITVNAIANGVSVAQEFTLNISSVNDAPIIESSLEDITLNLTKSFVLGLKVNDNEGDVLEVDVSINNNTFVKLNPQWTNPLQQADYDGVALSLKINAVVISAEETAIVTVRVKDGEFTTSKSFNITLITTDQEAINEANNRAKIIKILPPILYLILADNNTTTIK